MHLRWKRLYCNTFQIKYYFNSIRTMQNKSKLEKNLLKLLQLAEYEIKIILILLEFKNHFFKLFTNGFQEIFKLNLKWPLKSRQSWRHYPKH